MPEKLLDSATYWEVRRSIGAGAAPRAGLGTLCWRWLWGHRSELAVVWVCWYLVAVFAGLTTGWWGLAIFGVLVALALTWGPSRRRVRAVFTRSRLRRRFARAVRATGCPGPTDAVPRPGRIRFVPAGQVMRVRLPAGWHIGDLERRAEAIAAYLGVREVRVLRHRANAGLAELRIIRRDPLSGSGRLVWPWLGQVRTSLWDAIPVGLGEDGEVVTMSLPERNIVIGGEPGGGKSVALSLLVAAAALDPAARLSLFDGKLVELAGWRGCADHFVGPDLEEAGEVLDQLRADMLARYQYLQASGARKITRADEDRFPLRLVVIDELALFTAGTSAERKIVAEVSGLLRDLVARGRAAGIIVVAATQKPSSDIVPTSLRDLFGFRWALRCSTPQASDTILGQGWASQGFSASSIDGADRGVGFLLHEGGQPVRLRSFHLSDEELATLARRAESLRRLTAEDAS